MKWHQKFVDKVQHAVIELIGVADIHNLLGSRYFLWMEASLTVSWEVLESFPFKESNGNYCREVAGLGPVISYSVTIVAVDTERFDVMEKVASSTAIEFIEEVIEKFDFEPLVISAGKLAFGVCESDYYDCLEF